MRRLLIATLVLATGSLLVQEPGYSTVGPQVDAEPLKSVPGSVPHAEPTSVGMIAYADSQVYTIRTDGSHRRQLTTTGGFAPVWSPDGTQIAFERRDSKWRGSIWLMSASGGSEQKLAQGINPAWSPDGQRLSYACRLGRFNDSVSGLCVLDLQTRAETVVVARRAAWPGAGSPTWSPDGAWIAFTRFSSKGDDYSTYRQLFRVKPDGTELTAIPNTYPLGTEPAWSPDGATILYTERYDGRDGEDSGDLWSIHPDGTQRTQVTSRKGHDQNASWSSDGQRIVFESVGAHYPYQAGIWAMGRDGTAKEFVVRHGRMPSWRPNFTAPPIPDADPPVATGSEIAYVAATDAGYDLFTVRPDGTQIRQLTTSGGASAPSWSPDHSHIAYFKRAPNNWYDSALWVMDVRSGESERVGRIGGYSVAWSPDGHRLVWGNWYKLVIFDLRTGERTRLPFRRNIEPVHPTWSPDGRRIAFSELGDILVVPARGGAFRHVTRLRGYETHPDWSPGGQRIVFTRQGGPSWRPTTEILSVRPNGTGLRSVANTSELDHTPSWSPAGRRLAFYSDGPRPYGASPRPGLWTVGPTGGEPQHVLQDRTITYVDW